MCLLGSAPGCASGSPGLAANSGCSSSTSGSPAGTLSCGCTARGSPTWRSGGAGSLSLIPPGGCPQPQPVTLRWCCTSTCTVAEVNGGRWPCPLTPLPSASSSLRSAWRGTSRWPWLAGTGALSVRRESPRGRKTASSTQKERQQHETRNQDHFSAYRYCGDRIRNGLRVYWPADPRQEPSHRTRGTLGSWPQRPSQWGY